MYLSNGAKLLSFLQLQVTTVTIIFMLFFGDSLGQSRLTRMPTFYGKRSGESKTSRTSPNFGLDKLESLLGSSSLSSSSKHLTNEDGYGLGSPRNPSLMKLVSGDGVFFAQPEEDLSSLKNYEGEFIGGLTKKRTLENAQIVDRGDYDDNDDADQRIVETVQKISEYNKIMEKIMESNRRLQIDLLEVIKEEKDILAARSRDVRIVSGARPLPSLKRGSLARLPQFYGKRK